MRNEQKDSAYYLYWIHRGCHTNIKTEGYIGVTYNFEKRFRQHKINANLDMRNHVINAIRKYDNLIYDILCMGSREYICELENNLRPKTNIGWNIAIGGKIPIPPKIDRSTRIQIAKKRISYSKQTAQNILIDYYSNGLTKSKLVEKYNINSGSILNIILGRQIAYHDLEELRSSIIDKRPFNSRQWATLPEQLYDEILKERESGKTFKEISEKYDIPIRTIRDYCKGELEYLKSFSCYRALPLRMNKTLTLNNKTQTIKEWSNDTGIKSGTIRKRINSGWSINKTLNTPTS